MEQGGCHHYDITGVYLLGFGQIDLVRRRGTSCPFQPTCAFNIVLRGFDEENGSDALEYTCNPIEVIPHINPILAMIGRDWI